MTFLSILFFTIGCTKEKVPSVIGKWNIVESHDDVGNTVYNSSNQTFIRFNSNGTFEMDTVHSYFAYKNALQNMNRYKLISNAEIRFYSSNFTDSITLGYFLNKQLTLSFRFTVEKFISK